MNDKPAKIEMITEGRSTRSARATSACRARCQEASRAREVAQARTYMGVAEKFDRAEGARTALS
jgi:hypothetical protein